MSDAATLEFGVDLTCGNCVKKTEDALSQKKGISDFKISLEKQQVVVTTTQSSNVIKGIIESTGKRAVLLGVGSESGKPISAAVAILGGLIGSGDNKVQGVIRFMQYSSGRCLIDGIIDGLKPGQHAMAIHESGDLSEGCASVGDHYNPRGTRHGSPLDEESKRHVGDLGNVVADETGRANFRFTDSLIEVDDVIGRSLVIADDKDDYGLGSNPMSLVKRLAHGIKPINYSHDCVFQVNGNCGKLISCGIIARSAGIFENAKRICACDGVSLWDERDKPLVGPGRSDIQQK